MAFRGGDAFPQTEVSALTRISPPASPRLQGWGLCSKEEPSHVKVDSFFVSGPALLAAVLLVLAIGSSSSEGRYFRIVDGELVEFEPEEEELVSRYFAWTLSGDAIQFDLSLPTEGEVYGRGGGVSAYIIQYERIAAVVGWDQLSASLCYGFYGIPICRGGSLSDPGRYLRLVDDEFIPIDLSGPHTGQFTDLLNGDHVEIEPAEPISLPSLFAALEPIAAVVGWDKLDCWIDHPYYIDGIRVYIGGHFRGTSGVADTCGSWMADSSPWIIS